MQLLVTTRSSICPVNYVQSTGSGRMKEKTGVEVDKGGDKQGLDGGHDIGV